MASLWELSSEEEIHHFKNESLGMAFLHLCHLALCRGVPLEKVAKKIRCPGMGQRRWMAIHGHPGAKAETLYTAVPSFIEHLLYAGTSCGC